MAIEMGAADSGSQSKSFIAFALLCGVYLGLLAGDQVVPVELLGSEEISVRSIGAAICVVLWAALSTGSEGARPARKAYVPLFIAFNAYIMTTSFWSPVGSNVEDFIIDAAYVLIFILLGMAGVRKVGHRGLTAFLTFVVLVGVLFAVAGIAASGVSGGRVAAFGGGPNVFARIVGMSLVIAVFKALESGRAWWLLPMGPLFVALVLSGSRGAMVALLIAAVVSSSFTLRWVHKQGRILKTVVALSLSVVAIWVVAGRQILEVFDARFTQQLIQERQTAGRTDLYVGAVRIWRESPLLGRGVGSFAVEYGRGFRYAHNLILDVLVDGGLVGLALFLLALGAGLWSVHGSAGSKTTGMFVVLAIFILGASQFSGTYYDARFMWVFLGMATALQGTGGSGIAPGAVPERRVCFSGAVGGPRL